MNLKMREGAEKTGTGKADREGGTHTGTGRRFSQGEKSHQEQTGVPKEQKQMVRMGLLRGPTT